MHSRTVFIIDDDPSIRDALSLLLSLRGHPTATFASAEDFLAAVQPSWGGCALLDIRMPGMSGLELQRCLRERAPALAVVVITAHGDVAAAREAFLADAVDFIEKPFDGEQLLRAIELALDRSAGGGQAPGGTASASASAPVSASSAPSPASAPAVAGPAPAAAAGPGGRLSPREHEVMQLMVQGMHNRRIAEVLGISPRTVEVHKARVMEKLGAANLVDLVRRVDRGEV